MGIKILLITLIVVIAGVGIAAVATRPVTHVHNENCKWIAPLKVNYVMCSDGTVREKG